MSYIWEVRKNVETPSSIQLCCHTMQITRLDVHWSVFQEAKPFWRVWNAAGSNGRGIIGVLETNFVEPAHDKQGFENTPVLQRLHHRLLHFQKEFWKKKSREIGYAGNRRTAEFQAKESSVSSSEKRSVSLSKETKHVLKGKSDEALPDNISRSDTSSQSTDTNITCNANERASCLDADLELENQQLMDKVKKMKEYYSHNLQLEREKCKRIQSQIDVLAPESGAMILEENNSLKDRIKKMEESLSRDLELERYRCRILETQLKEKEQMSENLDKETDTIIEDFSEERDRRVNEEENLRNKMKEASNIIDELRKKVIVLVNMNSPFSKQEH